MEERKRPDWDEFFMLSAIIASTRSSCIHLQTGAVIVKDKRIISSGYNGAPPGIKNCLEVGCRKDREGVPFEDKTKGVCRGIHAELNALVQVARKDLKDATIYSVYLPCSSCVKVIAGSGIKEVVYLKVYDEPNSLANEIFLEAGIILRKINIDFDKNLNFIKDIIKSET